MSNIVVNGVGTIGKRVAHAIKKQDDLNLVGISDVSPTPVLRTALSEGSPLYGTSLFCSLPEKREELEEAGFYVEGNLPDLLNSGKVDLVVDATPSGIDEKNKPLYEKAGVKAIFQGGAKGSIAPVSFNAFANYEEASGEQFVRVVSCNTTALLRTLWSVNKEVEVQKAVASLTRRGGDPPQDSRGPINSIIPVSEVPSHHGPDFQKVLPEIDITTLAVKVPTTLAHVHMVNVELSESVSESKVKEIFEGTPRIKLFKASQGFSSTSKIIERYRDLRLRYDMPQVGVWEETITTEGDRLYWVHMVQQESIVIPDNIDAIRSMLQLEDKWDSISKTNSSFDL